MYLVRVATHDDELRTYIRAEADIQAQGQGEKERETNTGPEVVVGRVVAIDGRR